MSSKDVTVVCYQTDPKMLYVYSLWACKSTTYSVRLSILVHFGFTFSTSCSFSSWCYHEQLRYVSSNCYKQRFSTCQCLSAGYWSRLAGLSSPALVGIIAPTVPRRHSPLQFCLVFYILSTCTYMLYRAGITIILLTFPIWPHNANYDMVLVFWCYSSCLLVYSINFLF